MKPMRLRDVATVRLSNVDKVTNASETAVRLCNYVDVYNNDFITGDIDFNTGSATKAEIDRFRLRIGDVVITKDSEERKDIGVPAFVRQTSADLVCGYHLAILRPAPKRIRGDFLFWALQAQGAQDEFSNCAKGVTRFGLSLDGIKSIPMRCPDLGVQKQIAAFLDRETGRIDKLITKRERFDSLVEERKSTLTIRAVNGAILGLAPNGRSGWFDAVPKSWDVRRARFLFRESAHRSTTGQEHLLSVSHLTGVTLRSEKNVNMFLAESTEGYKLVHAGDVVVNTMWAWMGAMGVSQLDGLISPSYCVSEFIVYRDQLVERAFQSRNFHFNRASLLVVGEDDRPAGHLGSNTWIFYFAQRPARELGVRRFRNCAGRSAALSAPGAPGRCDRVSPRMWKEHVALSPREDAQTVSTAGKSVLDAYLGAFWKR